jgi:hypothetical protein
MVGGDATDEPKDALVHDTAALALARSRDPRALELLAQALRQAGRTSETARTALVAHPPLGIEAILAARGAPTESLVGLLGDLGDADAIPLLEATTRSPLPALRAEAIASLFRLDPKHAAGFARELAADRDLGVRVQATRTLVLTRAPEAPARLAALLADPLGSSAALEMALEAKSEDLGATLARARVSDDEREAWLAALGQSGGKAALGVLATSFGGRRRTPWRSRRTTTRATCSKTPSASRRNGATQCERSLWPKRADGTSAISTRLSARSRALVTRAIAPHGRSRSPPPNPSEPKRW